MLLVTGASGFLGSTFLREAAAAGRSFVAAYGRGTWAPPPPPGVRAVSADLTRPGAAQELVNNVGPGWVVNCAGLANVDECERDPLRAHLLNAELPRALASACADSGAGLVHISTDSVFDGRTGGYSEKGEPGPLNVYASSKLEGERAVCDAFPAALVVRTNFIGVSRSRRAGLADWITSELAAGRRVPGFTDVIFAPLLANDLSRILLSMIDAGLAGLYHAAACDACSKYEFACMVADAVGSDRALVDRTELKSAKLAAARPLNTSLSPRRLEAALGISMPSVATAVDRYAAIRAADCNAARQSSVTT